MYFHITRNLNLSKIRGDQQHRINSFIRDGIEFGTLYFFQFAGQRFFISSLNFVLKVLFQFHLFAKKKETKRKRDLIIYFSNYY